MPDPPTEQGATQGVPKIPESNKEKTSAADDEVSTCCTSEICSLTTGHDAAIVVDGEEVSDIPCKETFDSAASDATTFKSDGHGAR